MSEENLINKPDENEISKPEETEIIKPEENPIIKPTVPFWRPIPNGLTEGKMVEIRGSVPYGSDVFTINFTAGEDYGDVKVDRLLHISVRFYHRKVVRNAFIATAWGKEEIEDGLPFSSGKPFIMLILVEQDSFKIAIDGQHRWEFAHRANFSLASHLHIDGSVVINEVKFVDKFYPVPQPGTCGPPPLTMPTSVINQPHLPFYHTFPYGISPGSLIMLNGRPFVGAHRFTINFQTGQGPYPPPDIGFHLDVRFWNSTIVRNSRVNNIWEKEETDLATRFPFAAGKNFDIFIKVENDKFLVAINNQTFIEFMFRSLPISRFNTIFIENDAVLSCIKFEDC